MKIENWYKSFEKLLLCSYYQILTLGSANMYLIKKTWNVFNSHYCAWQPQVNIKETATISVMVISLNQPVFTVEKKLLEIQEWVYLFKIQYKTYFCLVSALLDALVMCVPDKHYTVFWLRSLQKALGWTVKILSVAAESQNQILRESTSKTFISFIAMDSSGAVIPAKEVKE